MQYLKLDTLLYITSSILEDIGKQLDQGLGSGHLPIKWEIISDDIISDIEKERDDALEDAEEWEDMHDELERETKRLEDKYDDLKDKYDDLEEKYNSLLATI